MNSILALEPKWPRNKTEVGKPPKMGPENRFFSKRAQDFELLKQVPESPHCLDFSGLNQYIGTLILSQSAIPRIDFGNSGNSGRPKTFSPIKFWTVQNRFKILRASE